MDPKRRLTKMPKKYDDFEMNAVTVLSDSDSDSTCSSKLGILKMDPKRRLAKMPKKYDDFEMNAVTVLSDSDSDSLSLSKSTPREEIQQDFLPKIMKRKRKFPNAACANTRVQQICTKTVAYEKPQTKKYFDMQLIRQRFQPMKLISADDNGLNIYELLQASIPAITVACKWMVICLDLEFTYLRLAGNIIKYEDIMKTVKLARAEKITIVLTDDMLKKKNNHNKFGIYCPHNYLDKIFVGPYFLNENLNLDTLSFDNGVLVTTNLFYQLMGKNVSRNGGWFYQMTVSEEKSIDDDYFKIIENSPQMLDGRVMKKRAEKIYAMKKT